MKYQRSNKHVENVRLAQEKAQQWHKDRKQERIANYNLNPHLCTNCHQSLEYERRTNRFCSQSCSASFTNLGKTVSESTRQKQREAATLFAQNNRDKLVEQLSKYNPRAAVPRKDKPCLFCKQVMKLIPSEYQSRQFCKLECRIAFNKTEAGRKKFSEMAKKTIKDGKHKGWASRGNLEPSYPEKYFQSVLDNSQIVYEREHKVGKYFVDFAIHDRKIALEIDGSQHRLPDRAEVDRRKDQFLQENGWTVFRIDWYNPTTDLNKERLYSQINEFKKLFV